MQNDLFLPALLRDARLVVAVATTTEVVRAAQAAHELAPSSTVALGRLITATALTGLLQRTAGITSLQVVCEGRLRQVFAEVTSTGDLRGFVKTKDLDLPQMVEGGPRRRRSIALGVGEGLLAVTREPRGAHFTQSTTKLVSGEIDEDVEHFLNVSDQIPTALICDVLLDGEDRIVHSAGLIVQGMPDSDGERLAAMKEWMDAGAFSPLLKDGALQAEELLASAAPEDKSVEAPIPLQWRCRCSYERVLGALQMLEAEELAEMALKRETATIDCDFCAKTYKVEPDEIARLTSNAARAKG